MTMNGSGAVHPHQSIKVLLAALAVIAGVGWVAGPAQAGPLYSYSILAKTGDVIGGKTLAGITNGAGISINNNGAVTFVATYTGGSGIFTQSNLIVQTGDVVGGKTLSGLLYPVINLGGTIAFQGTYSESGTKTGIFTQFGKVATPGDVLDGVTVSQAFGPPDINDAGQVAYKIFHNGAVGAQFIDQDLVVDAGDIISGRSVDAFTQPAINNSGTLAFRTQWGAGTAAVATQFSEEAHTGENIGGVVWGGGFASSQAAINDNGVVVFHGTFAGGSAYFTQNGIVTKSGDVIGGMTITSYGGVARAAINDDGVVAHHVRMNNSTNVVITQESLIAAPGMSIGGKTLTSVMDGPDINDSGQIIFQATYTGGSAVFLASPITGDTLVNGDFETPGLAGWMIDGPGTASGIEAPAASGNHVARLTAGSPVTLTQVIDTPADPFTIQYDYQFLSITGVLTVLLDSQVVDTLAAPAGLAAGMTHRSVPISSLSLMDLSDVPISFRYDGPAGTQLLLDNVIAPEPSTSVFLLLSVMGLMTSRKRRLA